LGLSLTDSKERGSKSDECDEFVIHSCVILLLRSLQKSVPALPYRFNHLKPGRRNQ
jgi:hypothetical protein